MLMLKYSNSKNWYAVENGHVVREMCYFFVNGNGPKAHKTIDREVGYFS